MPPRSGKAKTGALNTVLSSVKCSVYVNLEDGSSDASKGIKAELKSLGATVEEAFAFGHTHMVWTNGPPGLLQAAKALQIKPVSFLWVEQCKQAGKLVDEDDFNPESSYSSNATKASTVGNANATATNNMEPIINQTATVRDPDSPFFHSSQRVDQEQEPHASKKSKSNDKKRQSTKDLQQDKEKKDNDGKKDEISTAPQQEVLKKKTPKNKTNPGRKEQSEDAEVVKKQKPIVPTAGFREITPRNKSTGNSSILKRRSERISDNNDYDSQSQEAVTTAEGPVKRAAAGRGASKETLIPFQIEKPPPQKRGRKKNNDIDATVPIAAQTQFSSPSFSQDPVLSTIRPDTVMKVSFEGISSQFESGSQSQSQITDQAHQQNHTLTSTATTVGVSIASRKRRKSANYDENILQTDSLSNSKLSAEPDGALPYCGSFTESQMDIVEGLTAIGNIVPQEEDGGSKKEISQKPAVRAKITRSQPKKNSTKKPNLKALATATDRRSTKETSASSKSKKNLNVVDASKDIDGKTSTNSEKTEEKCDANRKTNHVSRHMFTKKLICMSGFEVDDNIMLIDLVKKTLVPRLKGAQLIDFADETKVTTHLVVPDMDVPPRTLRVLFSLARGEENSFILKENWLYSCLEEEKWVDEKDYIHPRYSAPRKPNLFSAFHVYIGGDLVDPPLNVVKSLLRITGATIIDKIEAANLVLTDSAGKWLKEPRHCGVPKTPFDSQDLAKLAELSDECNIVSIKYLFDCLEKQEVIGRCKNISNILEFTQKGEYSSAKETKSSKSIKSKSVKSAKTTQQKKGSLKTTCPDTNGGEQKDSSNVFAPVVSKRTKGQSVSSSPQAELSAISPAGVSERTSFPPNTTSSTVSSGRSSKRGSAKDNLDLSDILVYHKRNAITPDTVQSSQTILDTDVKNGKYNNNMKQYNNFGASGIDSIGDDKDLSSTPELKACGHKVGATINDGMTGGRPPLSRLSRNAPVVMSQDDDTFVGDSQGF